MTRHSIAAILAVPVLLSPCTSSAQVQESPAPVGDPSLKPSIITKPNWLRIPTGDQINREYPARAFRQNVEGRAVIRCTVMSSGKLTQCHVVSETPEGYGFGAALLKLAKRFVMKPETIDGVPVEGANVTTPMRFRM
jgi:protein TonB